MQESNLPAVQDKQLVRVSKGLAFNYLQLFREFGEHSVLARDIIILTTSELNKDLFGGVQFTVDDIINLGYNRHYLQRLVPKFSSLSSDDIYQLQQEKYNELDKVEFTLQTVNNDFLRDKDGQFVKDENGNPIELPFLGSHLCVTNLEYTLYRLYMQQIQFIRKKPGTNINESTMFKFFSSLVIDYDQSTRKKTKHNYYIYPGNKIMEDFFHDYYLIEMGDYRNLKSNKIETTGAMRNFYIHVGRIIAKIRQNRVEKKPLYYILSVDDIVDIFNKEENNFYKSSSKGKKQNVERTLNLIIGKVDVAKFEYEFTKERPDGTMGKYAFYVKFTFSDEVLNYFDEKMRRLHLKKFHLHLKGYYIQKCGIGNFNENEFWSWVNSQEDIEAKYKHYEESYRDTYKVNLPENLDKIDYPRVNNKARRILKLSDNDINIPHKRTYHSEQEILSAAAEFKMSVEELIRKLNYKKDEKGYYS